MKGDYFVEAQGLTKRFFAVQALDDVAVAIKRGEIHALVGENGAGKSTLAKVISGVIRPDDGTLSINGREVHYASPHDALLDGITTITQEISLLSKQTVLQNVMLGQEDTHAGILDFKRMLARFGEIRALTGFEIDPRVRVSDLRLADQKKVEVMQSIARKAQLIVMDEPTAMLSDEETTIFLKIVRHLRDMGMTIIYVSHFLREVLDLANTVTVMRNGKVVRTTPVKQESIETLVDAMLGKSMAQMYPLKQMSPVDAPVILSVKGLKSDVFTDTNLSVRRGEIVGLAGLVGSGRSRLARTLFGAEPIFDGEIAVEGKPVRIRSVRDAMRAGIYMLPESRKEQGLLLKQSVQDNLSLPHLDSVTTVGGIIRGKAETERIDTLIKALNVQPPTMRNRVNSLSGGNQQKVLFGKWLFKQPRLFIVDEPTGGIDVGAKQAIYELIVQLASEGMAILLVSSEMEEILGLAHRVLVMREGRIVAELSEIDHSLTEDNVMRAAFGTV
ncbi:MAG: ATP-binding cassette domain-containing protein [Chloroflexi bacterium]|nr:ATP-binding cassette domain-containing protein [Chloroflexota bacterium]